jgi:hypothetical protein
MRLADDRRGRVPFALVGVLLLLGSTTYATTLATDGVRADRDVEMAMDRATAATETALRVAVSRAARDAARTPVAVPANSGWGDVIDDDRPFRDSLRIRIYVALRAGFDRAAYTHGDVTAAASLPATPTPDELDRAVDRVTVAGAENGTALRVTVRNVSVIARQEGRVVAREAVNRTVTVATPVLAMHDRTVRFERSLDRGPLEGRGLGRRLTSRLYPLTWARGYAQWGGLPISNVLATRHVGVATNGAVLELQREAYGRSDPRGREAQLRALGRLAVEDTRQGVNSPATGVVTSLTGTSTPEGLDPDDVPERVPRLAPTDAPGPDRQIEIGVNGTADRAFVSFLDGTGGPALDDVLQRSYRVDVRVRTEARLLETEQWARPRAPGPGASLEDEEVDTSVTVDPGDGPVPPTVEGWRRFRTDSRHVTVEHRIEWTWEIGNTTTVQSATVTERYAVGVAIDGRPAPVAGTPDNPVVPVFERGGALDGPNLADVPNRSIAFVNDSGGVDAVAAGRAIDEPLDVNGTVTGARPDELDEWVSDDVASLRRQVRNVSVTVRAAEAASGSANPSARLAAELRSRRAALVAAPDRYDGAADRARVAARAAYLDRVLARLDARAERSDEANARLAAELRRRGVDLVGRASDVLTNRTAASHDPRPVAGPLGGEDVFVPQGGPSYLDVRGVDEVDAPWTDQTGVRYPLATRNINVFTVPYGDAADTVVGFVGGAETVRLRTAALTLRAAENTSDPSDELRRERDDLREAVNDSLVVVDRRTRSTLARETSLRRNERYRAVDRALSSWSRPSARALAVTNGSYVPRLVDAAGVEGRTADRLRVRLRVAVAEMRNSSQLRVERHHVNGTATVLRRVSTTVATEALGTVAANGTERLATRTDGKLVVLPAGLPLLPTPTNWYATVNVWEVQVRGEYPRFAVRTRRGTPDETVTYVRDGGVAELDVDGDGNPERLGRAERIDFSVRTVVLVAVPPGKLGVGDVNGQAHETSPGWDRWEGESE